MKRLRTIIGVVAIAALALSSATSHQVAWAVIALVAGLAMLVLGVIEIRARRA